MVEILKAGENELCWLVNQYEAFSLDDSFSFFDKFIPRQDVSIIFHLEKGIPFVYGNQPIKLKSCFIAPIVPRALLLKINGTMDTFVVSCKATAFSRLFNVDLSPTKSYYISLPEVFSSLLAKITKVKTLEERINCFLEFINTIHPQKYCPDEIDLFYDKIIANSVSLSIKDLINESGINERTFERHFIKRTGVKPKRLMQIVRFNYLWSKVIEEQAVDYQNLVFEGKYFDQTHFIKDFKAITGETPNYFFKRNLDAVKIFSGKNGFK